MRGNTRDRHFTEHLIVLRHAGIHFGRITERKHDVLANKITIAHVCDGDGVRTTHTHTLNGVASLVVGHCTVFCS